MVMRSTKVVAVMVAVAVVAVGCSSRKKKKHTPQSLRITTISLPDATEAVAYSYTLQATGGNSSNYNWSISGQPSWLSIHASTGELSGTPPAGSAGSYTFTAEITDGQQTASKQFSLTVKPAGSLTITTTTLPDATEGVSYSATIEATGSTTPYTWSVSGLPSGLSWSQVGGNVEISGTPDVGTAGTYNIDVTVTDSSSPTQSVSVTLQLVVNPAGGTTLKADFEASPIYGNAPLAVTFTDKSTGNPTSWEWDFDNDGKVDSTDQNPKWTYNDPGWYTVKLTVSDGTNSDTCVKEMYIQVAADVYYVDGVNGDDANSGLDWSDAFATIGKALSVAGDYDLVLVADATYNETDLNFNGKKIYLKGVDHNTTGGQPVIDCQGNGRAFYFGSGETEDCVIDNFTIQNGKVEDTYGGAILCDNNSSPTIKNCVFESNRAEDTNGADDKESGGAIYCSDSSSPCVINCVFSGNSATGSNSCGGAICCYYNIPLINGCKFSGNSADYDGGAIYCYFSSPSISDCVFGDNSAAGHNGGAIYCYCGGADISNCTFSNNSAKHDGGAIYCNNSGPSIANCTFSGNNSANGDGGAIKFSFCAPVTVTGCMFSNNECALLGGAIECEASDRVTIDECEFIGNTATVRGGATNWYLNWAPITVTNCVFRANQAEYGGAISAQSYGLITSCEFEENIADRGGAICREIGSGVDVTVVNCIFSGNHVNKSGGAICCRSEGLLNIASSTLSANTAENGGAVYCDGSSSLTLNNCIVWGNSAVAGGNEVYADSGCSVALNYCCVDNSAGAYDGGGTVDDTNNCIFVDPQFVDAANGDYHLK
ncbi:MAG: hypothetical protein DRP63_02335, partial [Planctomycetota bacterium]